jgi:hypothetical protein
MATACWGESYIFTEIGKETNGNFKMYLPKLELNQQKYAGKLFGTSCYYLSEFSGGLIFTAPRSNMSAMNHSAIEASWDVGIEVGPVWSTFSLGGLYRILGNNEGLPEGFDLNNRWRLGLAWK